MSKQEQYEKAYESMENKNRQVTNKLYVEKTISPSKALIEFEAILKEYKEELAKIMDIKK